MDFISYVGENVFALDTTDPFNPLIVEVKLQAVSISASLKETNVVANQKQSPFFEAILCRSNGMMFRTYNPKHIAICKSDIEEALKEYIKLLIQSQEEEHHERLRKLEAIAKLEMPNQQGEA